MAPSARPATTMHMSDALISPAVGGCLWAATAGLVAHASRRVEQAGEDARVPLMGVLGAFVFAAQMVNFSIPGTGSSGHLGGGLLLAILLGPHAAFLVMASVLTVQALLFADGGLLALGCNVFNLAFLSCYVAYPLVWRPLAGRAPGYGRLVAASLAAAVAALLAGALGVALETTASGLSSLPLAPFAQVMAGIHLAIGLVEGLVTAAVLLVVARARPELLATASRVEPRRLWPLVASAALAAVITAGLLSPLASERPDGLEWSVARVAGEAGAPAGSSPWHAALRRVQALTARFPDYAPADREAQGRGARGPAVPGLIGAGVVLGVAVLAGALVRAARRRAGRA